MFHHHTENSPSTGEPPTPPFNMKPEIVVEKDQDVIPASLNKSSSSILRNEVTPCQQNLDPNRLAMIRLSLFEPCTHPDNDRTYLRIRQTHPDDDSGVALSPTITGYSCEEENFSYASKEPSALISPRPGDDSGVSVPGSGMRCSPEISTMFDSDSSFETIRRRGSESSFEIVSMLDSDPMDETIQRSFHLTTHRFSEASEEEEDSDDVPIIKLCKQCLSASCKCQRFDFPTAIQSSDHGCDMSINSNEQTLSFPGPSNMPVEIPVSQGHSAHSPSVSDTYHPIHSMPSKSFSPAVTIPSVRPTRSPWMPGMLSQSLPPRLTLSIFTTYPRRDMVHRNTRQDVGKSSSNPLESHNFRCRLRCTEGSSSTTEQFFDTSLEESDDEDEVFFQARDMAEEDLRLLGVRPRLNSNVTAQPLPDLVLPLSPPHRRYRSASVNLPPDHAVLQSIGRNLRRMSDNFQPGGSESENSASPKSPQFSVFRSP